MKTVYLLYISLGVALATIFYLYKSHKETIKKIETIQNLVSSIQQVPVMKYNDSEIQSTIQHRCDEIEELIHFVNDDLANKFIENVNKINESKQTNIPKTFFSDFIDQNISQNNNVKDYEENPILDIDGFKDNDYAALSLSSLNKSNHDITSVHNSSVRNDKNTLGEINLENNEDFIETYNLDSKINIDFEEDLSNKIENNIVIDNVSRKSASLQALNNTIPINESNNPSHASHNHSVSDNSKLPKLNELKQLAKSRDLSVNGNKKEIIQRLIGNGYIF
jgi:hypothetical protein